jgi:SAM-dependent methyltransferase
VDRFRFTTIAHAGMAILNPIGSDKLDAALGRLELSPGARVLDVGCGKAEALARLAEGYGVSGIGVDPNPEFLRDAAQRHSALDLRLGEIGEQEFAPHSFDAAICVGSTHAFGDYAGALASLHPLLRPGGTALIGEGYWKQRPEPEYLARLDAQESDFTDLVGLASRARETGYALRWSAVADDAEWDAYETAYAENVERFVREHPDDPDATEVTVRIRRWHDGYRKWGRETLGFGLFVLKI